MNDYTVTVLDEDTSTIHHIHFVSEYPVGSVGFFEDMYEIIEDNILSFGYKVLEFEEGF